MAAYVLARSELPWMRWIYLLVVVCFAVPVHAVLVPLYQEISAAGMLNSRLAIVLPYVAYGIPFTTVLFYAFFLDFPRELEDAALVDGCTPFGAFWRIVLPNALPGLVATFVYAFLFAPIVILILFSFNDSRRNFAWRGFTLDWYPRLFANDELLDALSVTLQVAIVAVLVSVILGSLIGLGLARLQSRARAGADTLLLLPMVTPEIVVGLSLLLFFLQLFDANGSVGQLQIAHITFCISYVAVVVRARAAGMDPNLEEAARDLGASALGAFRFVTLPILAPAIAAGAVRWKNDST